jgi:hypothetical protein
LAFANYAVMANPLRKLIASGFLAMFMLGACGSSKPPPRSTTTTKTQTETETPDGKTRVETKATVVEEADGTVKKSETTNTTVPPK